MSKGEGMSGSGPGRSPQESLTTILIAMHDAWLAAIGLRGNLTAQSAESDPGAASPVAALLGPMITTFAAMADWAAVNRQRFDQPSAGPAMGLPPTSQENSAVTDFVLPMGQAMIIAANRSVSYWFGLAQILGNHQATLAQLVVVDPTSGRGPESGRLTAADELRALLREVGELGVRQARILQSELNHLDESLVQNFQQPDLSGSYRRRWRSKI
jgi:hypothetical protein